jgi:hypothetical protein
MKKLLIGLSLLAFSATANADFFGGNNGEWKMGPQGPYYEESDWPEWTPMYWMEEMMDSFDDDDSGYGNNGFMGGMPFMGNNNNFGGMPFMGNNNNNYPVMPYGAPMMAPMPYAQQPMMAPPMMAPMPIPAAPPAAVPGPAIAAPAAN